MGCLFVVSAPSGAGKTSLVNAAIEKEPSIQLSVSHTTRPQRPGETHGEDYYFVSTAEFNQLVAKNAFLEHATVFDNQYGTSQNNIETILAQGKDVILEVDWQGAEQIKALLPDCITITILPPSRQTLEQRLFNRQQDDEATIARRMQEAINEMSHYHASNYLLINDNFNQALADLLTIIHAARLGSPQQSLRHQALIDKLLSQD